MSSSHHALSYAKARYIPFTSSFFFNDTPTTEIYTLSYTTLFRSLLVGHGAGIHGPGAAAELHRAIRQAAPRARSEEHTSELQSHHDLVCRLLLEKKKHSSRKTMAVK